MLPFSEAKANYFRELLAASGGNVALAAGWAGLGRSCFYRKLITEGVVLQKHKTPPSPAPVGVLMFREWREKYFRNLVAEFPVVSIAARAAGMHRTRLYRVMKGYGIPIPHLERSDVHYRNRGNAAWQALR